jgi:ATP-dependent Clp protease ATP-binding subunit ClpA
MQIYQIHIKELNANAKFKVLTTSEIDEFMNSLSRAEKKDLKKSVLQYVVFNLNSDIASSLSSMSRAAAEQALDALYSGCIMLNPGLDLEHWINIAYSTTSFEPEKEDPNISLDEVRNFIKSTRDIKKRTTAPVVDKKKMSKQKFLGLESHLKNNVIGQEEAIEEVILALTRSQADMHDPNKPLGVFLFAGSSGVGKTHLANALHKYLYGDNSHMIRIDCGEFQHKHENQKLLGSPPGYVGHDEGGQLTNQVKKNPHTVVLLDEIEKAHQDLWSTFLRIFDEGLVTDSKGELISFRDTIIILTTNLGNDKTADGLRDTGVGFYGSPEIKLVIKDPPKRSVMERNTFDAINKYFKPELLNRIDKMIVFNYLRSEDYEKIAQIEMAHVAEKLAKKGLSLNYTDNVISGLIHLGLDAIKGARGISQVRRDKLESPLAKTIVETHIPKGTIFHIDYLDDNFVFNIEKPTKKVTTKEVG